MTFRKKMISGAAALALAGTSIMAAVSVEQDGTGDYLLAPAYYAYDADSGQKWQTEIKVVNTNTTSAVVAKVVIRSYDDSSEVLDFPIYLTPGDIWTGTLKQQGSDIVVESHDDSIMLGGQVDSNGILQPVDRGDDSDGVTLALNKPMKYGYVEVLGIAEYNATVLQTIDPNWRENCDLNKTLFYNAVRFHDPAKVDDLNVSDAVDVTNSDLMGQQTIYAQSANKADRRYMKLNMLALGDLITPAEMAATIQGDTYENVLGTDTLLKNYIGAANVAAKLNQIKDVLAKSHVYVPYEGDGTSLNPITVHLTFPWKHEMYSNPTNVAYKINDGTTIFRDYAEHTNYQCKENCNPQENNTSTGFDPTADQSGRENPPQEHCETHDYSINNEIAYITESGGLFSNYAFKEGGYVDIDLSANNFAPNWKGVPVVPTTFYAKDIAGDGFYLNNHLYNQYLRERK